MKEVVFDTNFLMLAHQFKVDIFGQLEELLGAYEKVTCKGVIEELEKLGLGKGRDGVAARYALKLVGEGRVKVRKNEGEVDEWILRYCRSRGAVACTVDKELRERLKKEGVKVIILKGGKKLEFA